MIKGLQRFLEGKICDIKSIKTAVSVVPRKQYQRHQKEVSMILFF
jgi:hypothetical protein